MSSTPAGAGMDRATPFYRDSRVIGLLVQTVFVGIVVLVGAFLINNMWIGLRASNMSLGWGFLNQEAGFAISEGAVFQPTDSYGRAFVVGIGNTLRVAVAGIILATVLGVFTGIARLSPNWLLRTLAGGYIELIRNTPLLVQLFFLYFAVILKLPDLKNSITVPGLALLSKRGIAITWFDISESGQTLYYWLGIALFLAAAAGLLRRRRLEAAGRVGSPLLWALPAFVATLLLGYGVTAATGSLPTEVTYELRRGDRGTLFVDVDGNGRYRSGVDRPIRFVPVTLVAENGTELATVNTDREGGFRFEVEEGGERVTWQSPTPIILSQPEVQGFSYKGGQQLSPEFAALLFGLVLYTAAFIAEIVRAGINAVPKGQWEASRALGLTQGRTLRMIVLPQALRVIIPPMTSQYLNLTKNSSLAIAVGYPDLFSVSRTIFNQSGAVVQMFVLIMVTYLSISLLTSACMNWYNQRMALVER